jgi:hypothetical protein
MEGWEIERFLLYQAFLVSDFLPQSKDAEPSILNGSVLTKNLDMSSAAVWGVYTLLSTLPIVSPHERMSSAMRLKRILRLGSSNCAVY